MAKKLHLIRFELLKEFEMHSSPLPKVINKGTIRSPDLSPSPGGAQTVLAQVTDDKHEHTKELLVSKRLVTPDIDYQDVIRVKPVCLINNTSPVAVAHQNLRLP